MLPRGVCSAAALGVVLATSPQAMAQESFSGSMLCEVQSTAVTAIRDGQATKYDSISGGLESGDPLRLIYYAEPATFDLSLYLLAVPDDDLPIMGWSSVRSLGGTRMPSAPMTDTGNSLVSNSRFSSMSFGRDFIRFDNALGGGAITLQRYFRTDWHALAQRPVPLDGPNMAVETFSMDCRQERERLEDVMQLFEGVSRSGE
jgi:hypothetical protein